MFVMGMDAEAARARVRKARALVEEGSSELAQSGLAVFHLLPEISWCSPAASVFAARAEQFVIELSALVHRAEAYAAELEEAEWLVVGETCG